MQTKWLMVFMILATAGCQSASRETQQEPPAAIKKSQSPNSTSQISANGRTELQVKVTSSGYEPELLQAPAGKPVRIVFTRMNEEECTHQVVFPEKNIKKDLQVNQPVAVEFTMPESGKVNFTCGMDMARGSVEAQ